MSDIDFHSATPPVADAFQAATLTALQELAQVNLYPDLLAAERMRSEEVLLAAIQLLRPVPGTMILVLSAKTALQLAARYLPEGTQLSEEMIDDVAGEFANVIAGQAKTILKGTAFHFSLSTPVVTRAESLAKSSIFGGVKLGASLDCPLGHVLVLVDLQPCTNA